MATNPIDPKAFLSQAANAKAKFSMLIERCAEAAMMRGEKSFTVPITNLPVGIGGPERTITTEPYEKVLDAWRNAGDTGWTIIREHYGRNETQLVFLPNP